MKTLAKISAAVLAFAVSLCCFAGCNPESSDANTETVYYTYYTVTFDLDGGEVKGKDLSNGVKVESGTELNLENYKPEKSDYTFEGWLSGETKYAANAHITVNSDITLKAQWELIHVDKFTVTFDPAGGTLNGSAETLTFQAEKNDALDFSDYVPERDTYTFKGWKTGETLYSVGTYTVADDVDFVAVWTKNPSADENFIFAETQEKDGYILKGLAETSTITEIVVPGYYQNKPVLKIADHAFGYDDKIVSVDLSNCDKLEEIESWNFSSCSALASVNLEGCSSLKKIGESCFSSNWSDTPSVLSEINLKGLSALEEIGSNCFKGSQYNGSMPVEKLDLSDCVSLTLIGEMSFWYLDAKEIDLSGTQIEDFGIQTIMHCHKLEKIDLPQTLNLTEDCRETFGDCANLKEISLDPLNIFMTVENGALMDADKTVIYKYAVKSDATKFTSPETVKTVMSWAFYKATNLTEIDFTETRLTEVKNSAFADCSNALLKMPFGEDGTYADHSPQCVFENKDWKDGVKETQYGKPAQAFKFTTNLTDGASVMEASFTFTASAEYGPSYALETCNLTVKVNGTQISGNGSYTVTLKDGENTIELIASSGEETETKTYKVNKMGQPEIECSLDKDNVNSSTEANYSFTVKLKSATGEYLDFSTSDVTIKVDCGFSGQLDKLTIGLTLTQTDTATVTVTFDYETMGSPILGGYEVYDQFNCEISVNLNGVNVSAQFKMIYEG